MLAKLIQSWPKSVTTSCLLASCHAFWPPLYIAPYFLDSFNLLDIFIIIKKEKEFFYFYVFDFMQVFPDAKVILTSRSASSWQKSMRETLYLVISVFFICHFCQSHCIPISAFSHSIKGLSFFWWKIFLHLMHWGS